MEKELTIKQVAELKGCSERHARRIIEDSGVSIKKEINPESGHERYLVNISDLPTELREKWERQNAPRRKLVKQPEPDTKAFDAYSKFERKQIALWQEICGAWMAFREEYEGRDAMSAFLPTAQSAYADKLRELGLTISSGILYRRTAAYRAGDLDGLIDKRGTALKGSSSIPDIIWDIYLSYYLDERRPTAAMCYGLLKDHLAEFKDAFEEDIMENLASERTFRRHLKQDVEEYVKIYGRLGEKAFMDRCLPYNERLYEQIFSNDYWIGDTYTLDAISRGSDGVDHRLYLSAFMDARSGIITGMFITDQPGSQATVMALRDGIIRCGIPKIIYVDNGREYLTRDIGGRGHRAKKGQDYAGDPPTILARLGIEMRNAIVRNAKAKPIERTFRTLKENVLKLVNTYCGGSIIERPESLKYTLKKGEVPLDGKLRDELRLLIDNRYNMAEYGGSIRADRGKTRLEVFRKNLISVRRASAEDLALMLMRSARPQTIMRQGVHLTISGERINYWNEITMDMQGHRVYLRYDPAHLESVRMYDAETDRFIAEVGLSRDNIMLFGELQENISIGQRNIRELKKRARNRLTDAKEAVPEGIRIDILDLAIRKAHRMPIGRIVPENVPVELVRCEEESYFEEDAPALAQGGGADIIDINTMIRNAEKRRRL